MNVNDEIWFEKHKETLFNLLEELIKNPKRHLFRNLTINEIDMIADMLLNQIKKFLGVEQ